MYNFCPTPCSTDNTHSEYVAKKILKKCRHTNNFMSVLLKKQFGTSDFPETSLNDVTDFPVLNKKELCFKVFLGTFQFRMCRSYVGDLINNPTGFIPTAQYLKTIKDSIFIDKLRGSKVIAVEISSRHKRGINNTKKYKAFVLYEPMINNCRSIKGDLFFCILRDNIFE